MLLQMKKTYLLVAIICLGISSYAQSNVYVAGYSYMQEKKRATLWKNGVAQYISSVNDDAEALSVFVAGGKVYVAGYDGKIATLWKNGIVQNLTDGNYSARANSVFVTEDDVYVAGYETNAQGKTVAKLWKNGVGQNLSNGYFNAKSTSVCVSKNDVYVAGNDENAAKLWKNGLAQTLSNEGNAYSVFVSNNDVYIAGNIEIEGYPIAVLWRNGAMQENISTVGYASSVFVSGNDVYVAVVNVMGYFVSLYKNDLEQSFTEEGETLAESIFVSENDVYVAGNESNEEGVTIAKLWKNGKVYNLTNDYQGGRATSVFVTK